MDKQSYEKTQEYVKFIRQKSLDIALNCGKSGCHIGGNFSCIEILAVLYANFMRRDFSVPLDSNRDMFFPSKAHCFFSHASALAKFGLVKNDLLLSFGTDNGKMTGKPWAPAQGLEYTGGSLGMGLALGVGTALHAKRHNLSYFSYVLLGDGECDEGSVWEAIMSASHYKLDNLVAIIDYNNLQFDGNNDEIMNLNSLEEKFKAFGWEAVSVNGHSIEELYDALSLEHKEKPLAVIAKTIKAHGIDRLENKVESHHAELTQADYDLAIKRFSKEGGI